jgi:hypothetical protein
VARSTYSLTRSASGERASRPTAASVIRTLDQTAARFAGGSTDQIFSIL